MTGYSGLISPGLTMTNGLPTEQVRDTLEVRDWSQFDLHHLLWQPRLPVRRFFELD